MASTMQVSTKKKRGLLLCNLLHFFRVHLHRYERLRRAVKARLHLPQSILHIVPAAEILS